MNHPTQEEFSSLKEKMIELKKQIRDLQTENQILNAELNDLNQNQRILAHDLKTPITGIKLTAETILETVDDTPIEKLKDQLKRIVKLTTKMGKMVREIIEEDRKTTIGGQKELVPVSVKMMISQAIEQLEPAATRKRISISLLKEIPDDLYVRGDEVLLDAVISNLLSNAIKYSPKRSTVSISHEILAGEVLIHVRDQGQGMSEFEIGKLFTSYQTLSSKPGSEESQTGLGLHISNAMIQKMNGSISAYSEGKNRGSTFVIHIPLAD